MRDTPTELQDFVRTGYTRAVRSVALLTHDMDSAQDAVDEAIARAWERLVRGRRIDCIPAWITTVAMNVARSRWYRKRRAPNPLDSHIADEPSDAESRIVVRDLIGKLSRRQQEVVVLHYLIDLDINTTADHLGIDATLRYGLNIPPTESIRQSHLASDNPYNTRKLPGLPPTPIANPGLASIQAAAHPAEKDYLFFVRKPDKIHHFFTASEAEFYAKACEYGFGCG